MIGGHGRYFAIRRTAPPVLVKTTRCRAGECSPSWNAARAVASAKSSISSASSDNWAISEAACDRIVPFLLDLANDPVHRLDRFDRELAHRRLGREHHGVGAVPNRIGDVAGFGAGRDRLRDHRFEHLGGGDHRQAQLVRNANDLLLGARHALRRQLHAEVAAGNHDAVGGTGDRAQVGERLRPLDLGDQAGLSTPNSRVHCAGKVAGELEVAGIVDETQAKVVNPNLDGVAGVDPVCIGQAPHR